MNSTFSRRMLAAIAVATVGNAHADDAASPEVRFVNTQRFDARSRAGLDFTLLDVHAHRIARFELHGQYVDAARGLGGYVRLPYTVQRQTERDPDMVFGNIAIGGLLVAPIKLAYVSIVFHVGFAAPVDSAEVNPELQIQGALLRPHDLYKNLPDVAILGGGISVLFRRAAVMARLDAGYDVNLQTASLLPSTKPALHANAAIGLTANGLSFALELSTLQMLGEQVYFLHLGHDTKHPESFGAWGLAVRYVQGPLNVYVAMSAVLSNRQREYVDSAPTMGVEYTF